MNRIVRISLAAAAAAWLTVPATAIQHQGGPKFGPAPLGAPVVKGLPSTQIPGVGLPSIPGVNAVLPGAQLPQAVVPAVSLPSVSQPSQVEAAAVPPAARPGSLNGLEEMTAQFSAPNASNGQAFRAGIQQFDGAAAASSYRYPTYAEQDKINESLSRGLQLSATARDVIKELTDRRGRLLVDIVIDPDSRAAYHGTAFRDQNGRRYVALTQDTIDNGSWAFIMATIGRELMNYNSFYKDIPASAERLAVQYAHMAMMFAEATNGSARAWSTNLDHNHMNEGTYFVWAWYEQLLKAMTSTTVGFIESEYFTWLRDFVAKQTASSSEYQYSLYERLTGRHYRPGDALHDTAIPSNVQKLNQGQHDAASAKIYGSDGNGDNGALTNMIGIVRSWFGRRGNI